MAESPIIINIDEIIFPQPEGEKVDCDDYSSGSDRSLETDDVDGVVHRNSGKNDHQNHTENSRSRRKRRHGSHGSRRHKGGSRHKLKHKGYQPYLNSEKIELQLKRKSLERQEKENAAAVVRHEGAEQFMIFPVAPFNSTQFLMDEHNENSPTNVYKYSSSAVLTSCSPQDRHNSVPSTPGESNPEAITFEKKDKEFTDYFTTAHAETLQSLPKAELVKHYINLEEKIAALQKKVAEAETYQNQDDNSYSKFDKHLDKVCTCDSTCSSDTNSLSSSNEEFVDISVVTQTSRYVDDTKVFSTEEEISSYSGAIKADSADSLS